MARAQAVAVAFARPITSEPVSRQQRSRHCCVSILPLAVIQRVPCTASPPARASKRTPLRCCALFARAHSGSRFDAISLLSLPRSAHGSCNSASGGCVCSTGFTGSTCSHCGTNYYACTCHVCLLRTLLVL